MMMMLLLLLMLLTDDDDNDDGDDDGDDDDDDDAAADDDDDDDSAINTLRLRHFETQLPKWKCQKQWQINTETEKSSMLLIWRPCDWLNLTEGRQILFDDHQFIK